MEQSMNQSEERRKVHFWGEVNGVDGTGGGPMETDGLLNLTLGGHDNGWTYVTAEIRGVKDNVEERLARITWNYSWNMDFRKDTSVTVPLYKGERYLIRWNEKRNAQKIWARVLWTPFP